MRIRDLAPYAVERVTESNQGCHATAGSGGSWRVLGEPEEEHTRVRIWHYGALMFAGYVGADGRVDPGRLFLGEGWSSISDKQGMNQILQSLELPIRFGADGYEPTNGIAEWRRDGWDPIVRDRFGINTRVPDWAM